MSAKMEHYLIGLLSPVRNLAQGGAKHADILSALDRTERAMRSAIRLPKYCAYCGEYFDIGYDRRFCSLRCHEIHRRGGTNGDGHNDTPEATGLQSTTREDGADGT